ncbi:MAG: hypothetical protein IKQ15_08350 [Kiritimatiellae bacterium]|nr:hypothetical protein [Kiritimatiellia bacterium]
MDGQNFADFADYAQKMGPGVQRDYPEPEAMQARRLLSGWRQWCARHGRSAEMPVEVVATVAAVEDARGWRQKAWDAAVRARNYGGAALTFEAKELAESWLAVRQRGPNGRRFARAGQ